MTRNPIRAVAFDAVGTLLFPIPGAPTVYEAAAHQRNLPTAGILERMRASYLAEEDIDRAAGWITSEQREIDRWRTIVTATIPGSDDTLFHALYDHFAMPESWTVAPDAASTIEQLQSQGYRVVLASNYDSRLDRVLDGKPELTPLRPAIISSQIGVRKPGVAFFARVAEHLDLPAAEILYVGDDHGNDFLGASAAGMPAVLLDPNDQRPTVTPRVRSLSELLALL